MASIDFMKLKRVFKKAGKIDPEARSSMWDDIKKGSQTEINFLIHIIKRNESLFVKPTE